MLQCQTRGSVVLNTVTSNTSALCPLYNLHFTIYNLQSRACAYPQIQCSISAIYIVSAATRPPSIGYLVFSSREVSSTGPAAPTQPAAAARISANTPRVAQLSTNCSVTHTFIHSFLKIPEILKTYSCCCSYAKYCIGIL